MKEFIEAFKALRHAPFALWVVIFAYSMDFMAYLGILPLMKAYLGTDIGIRPEYASTWVSVFTGSLTLFMLFVGKATEGKLGIRKSILLALSLSAFGRVIYSSAPFMGGATSIAISLLIVSLGEGIIQPVAYAGVKRYTDEKNGPMGYAMLYALFNLAAALTGPMSAHVRTSFDESHKAGTSSLTGFQAVNWVCTMVTIATIVAFFFMMSKKTEAAVVRSDVEDKSSGGMGAIFKDKRFLFFIFALLPVRTLFAHQWLTMPEYVLRSYPQDVADRMEWLVDSINPIIIFFGVPTITAFTKKYHVLTMMIIGSGVSAASTFLLCTGANTSLLITYFVIFSIGEALWSSRFYEYAAELAPPGKTAQYMGVASLPWFVAKTTTGFYSGFLLEKYVPKEGAKNGEMMWLIYGIIAMASPILLLSARKWVLAGMQPKAKAEPAAEEAAAA